MADAGIRVATFDCYGTLIDWEGGIGAFLSALALKYGDPNPEPGRRLPGHQQGAQQDPAGSGR